MKPVIERATVPTTQLHRLLVARGLSYERGARELGAKTGVYISTTYFASVVKGDRVPSVSLALHIAKAFGLKLDQVRFPKKGRNT